ncbi:hypothetical protein CR513_54176, partial [Mucuna pruriens]
MKYSLLERTCCALAWTVKRLRPYMLSHMTWLISKMDSIKYIFENPALTGKIARWQVALSEYDIVHVTQKAIKGSALAEHLAYHPLVDYQLMKHDFPDEDILMLMEEPGQEKGWAMYFDGASKMLSHGIGAVLISPEGRYFPFTVRFGFNCTNNMAEYETCAIRIVMAIEYQIKDLKVHRDSALVIHQLKGEWETRDRVG